MWYNAEINDHFLIILSFSFCIAKKIALGFKKDIKELWRYYL